MRLPSLSFSSRSSDSAKYTNKSSGTSILSGKISIGNNVSIPAVTTSSATSNSHAKYYQSSKHQHRERDGINIISTAPVHKKIIANDNNSSHIISRYINTNHMNMNMNSSTNSINGNNRISNPTPSHNNIYSLSLNRHHHDNQNHFANKHGVGCISTLTSPYCGSGVEKVHGGSKSDIGIPITRQIMLQQSHLRSVGGNNRRKSSFLPKSSLLPSVYSNLSLFDTTTNFSDLTNNNSTTSLMTGAIKKTGSKLLYTNAHRKSSLITNSVNGGHGPLLFHNNNNNNTDESEDNGNWENSYDNPIRSVSYERAFRMLSALSLS